MALATVPGAPVGRSPRRARRGRTAQAGPVRAFLYARVSGGPGQAEGGSTAGQLDSLDRLATERGWIVVDRLMDSRSGSTLDRPAMTEALGRLAAGEANLLAVSRLDRLSRSMGDFASLVTLSQAEGWKMYIGDLGLDPSAGPNYEMVAGILSVLAQWERRMIATRTSEGIAALKRDGRYQKIKVSPAVRQMIATMREHGDSCAKVAGRLNADHVPGPYGLVWTRGMVWGVWNRWMLDTAQGETAPLIESAGH